MTQGDTRSAALPARRPAQRRSRWAATVLLAGLLAGGAQAAGDDADLRQAARTIVAADPLPTLVTIDAEGQPRTRTMEVSAPRADFDFWLATRPGTRKLGQIAENPRVTLHFADDDGGAYVNVLGRASIHRDARTIEAHTFNSPASLAAFWPDHPDGYVLVHVVATRIEVVGAGIEGDPVSWRPASFEP